MTEQHLSGHARRAAPDLNPDGPTANTLFTVRDYVRLATSAFEAAGLSYGHGQASSYDEAIALVFWALHLPPETPDVVLDARLTTDEKNTVLALIHERTTLRCPLAYLTGEAWSYGLRFRSDKRALVPRSLLIEALHEGTENWITADGDSPLEVDPATILDLCTGGGSIAIHAAFCFPQAQVSAVDISPDALSLCAENIALHGLGQRISLHQSNLLKDVPTPASFGLILCNPPYVPQHSMDSLPEEFRAEPEIALAGGVDGMDLIHDILDTARQRLADDGVLLLEIGHEIDAFTEAFSRLSFATVPVTAGDQMVILMTRQDLQTGLARS